MQRREGGIISESRKGNYAASNADVLQMRAERKLGPLRLPLTVPISRYLDSSGSVWKT